MPTLPSLTTLTPFPAYYVGNQLRLSTCSGITWFPSGDYLATIHFSAGAINLYHFNRETNSCTLLQTIYGTDSAPLRGGDNLSISPDGSLLAVSVNINHTISLYKIDPETERIIPNPIAIIESPSRNVHGVGFTNDTRYLAHTTIRGSNSIFLHKIVRTDDSLTLTVVSEIPHQFDSLKPKSIAFTQDDQYLLVSYSPNVTTTPHTPNGLLAVYRLNKETDQFDPNPVDTYYNLNHFQGAEDLRLYPDDSAFFLSDQTYSKILIWAFDKETGKIGEPLSSLTNPEARLHFPHGIGISPDGNYLGVTNYGDDNFCIYAIH